MTDLLVGSRFISLRAVHTRWSMPPGGPVRMVDVDGIGYVLAVETRWPATVGSYER